MKIVLIFIVIILLSESSNCQGVKFITNRTWAEVKALAKEQKKSILVDVFATWCGPCKKMDAEVYSNSDLGKAIAEKYIAVKLQMDTTANDTEIIKQWRPIAKLFKLEYEINAYPTLLFFTPEGVAVNKSVGFKNTSEMNKIVAESLIPRFQYYNSLRRFDNGQLISDSIPSLALTAKAMGDSKISYKVIKSYFNTYINVAGDSSLLKKNVLELSNSFPELVYEEGSGGVYFNLFLKYPHQVDSLMNYPGFAEFFVRRVIYKEELEDEINEIPIQKAPSWKGIQLRIQNKYGQKWASKLMVLGKSSYYKNTKDWKNYCALIQSLIKRYPPQSDSKKFASAVGDELIIDDSWALNGEAWRVFQSTNDKDCLKMALKWSNLSISIKPLDNVMYLDTRANLLYRLGRIKDAIACELKAIEQDKLNAKVNGNHHGGFYRSLNETLNKFKRGEPTW